MARSASTLAPTLVLSLSWIAVSVLISGSTSLAQPPAQAPAPAAPSGSVPLTGTLKKIVDTGTIKIAHREKYLPFSYLDANKKPIGYSLDLCHKIIGAIKTELKMPNLQVKYLQVDPQTRIAAIRDGKADLECSGTSHTLSRRKDVDFSTTIMLSGTRLTALKGPVDLTDIKNLNGKKIAAAANTTMLKGAMAAAKEAKVQPIWIETKDHDSAFAAVASGKADAAALEDLVIRGLLANEKEAAKWQVGATPLSFESNALMLRQNDSAFRVVVDRAIARTFASGEILGIYDHWFKPLDLPMTDLMKSAIQMGALPE